MGIGAGDQRLVVLLADWISWREEAVAISRVPLELGGLARTQTLGQTE